MRKTLMTVAAAASLAAAVTAPTNAEARCWGCFAGAGFAAGVIGGALIANSAYGYGGYGGYYGGYGGYGYAPASYGYVPAPYAYGGPLIYGYATVPSYGYGYYAAQPYVGYGGYYGGGYRGYYGGVYGARRGYAGRYYARGYR